MKINYQKLQLDIALAEDKDNKRKGASGPQAFFWTS